MEAAPSAEEAGGGGERGGGGEGGGGGNKKNRGRNKNRPQPTKVSSRSALRFTFFSEIVSKVRPIEAVFNLESVEESRSPEWPKTKGTVWTFSNAEEASFEVREELNLSSMIDGMATSSEPRQRLLLHFINLADRAMNHSRGI